MPRAYLLALLLAAGTACAQDDVWSNIFKFQLTLAQKGDADAMYQIGEMYAQGKGTSKDKDKAISWLEKAHQAGHPGARSMIASLRKPETPEAPPAAPAPVSTPKASPPPRATPAAPKPQSPPPRQSATRSPNGSAGGPPSSRGSGSAATKAADPEPPRTSQPARSVITQPSPSSAPAAEPVSRPASREPTSTSVAQPEAATPRRSQPASQAAGGTEAVPEAFEQGGTPATEPIAGTGSQAEAQADESDKEAGFRGNPCASKAAKFTSLCR